ncbi:MAG: EamA family transporter [Desulfohalobiaceae bacterium]|nr:EamA family transporter [Desulfohalobiaceae bacterium]
MYLWILNALIILVLWGLWAFLPKLATQYIDPKSALLFQCLGSLLLGILMLFMLNFKPQFHPKGFMYGTLTGIFGFGGMLFYLYAVSKGKVSTLSTITALYPALVIVLAFLILKEPISLKNAIGFVFALLAIVLLTT